MLVVGFWDGGPGKMLISSCLAQVCKNQRQTPDVEMVEIQIPLEREGLDPEIEIE